MPTATSPKRPTLLELAERGERVFPPYPQVARYFATGTIEDARKRLSRTIERGDGPGLVIGAAGTGKSLLLQVLAAQYHELFDVVLLACTRLCTRRALLQAVLFELGLPYKLRDEGQLRLSLLDHLLSEETNPAGLLLLVDEAQALPVALLDELRVLTNLVRGGAPRVRVVLAGSSALEDTFAGTELESFSQRLSVRCYLAPFNREETTQFVRAQVAAAGSEPDELFAADAWDAVYDATDGVQRLVNQLCDRALLWAVEEGRSQIDRQVVQAAWSDLQQLPTPWETPPMTSEGAEAPPPTVEFGTLHDPMDDEHSTRAAQDDRPEASRLSEDCDSVTRETGMDYDEFLDIEPTELDEHDEAVEAAMSQLENRQQASAPEPLVEDPFAEPFDEEEFVLDNFAAWDDLFGRRSPYGPCPPRVENRRDPGFATLVQSAIDAMAMDVNASCRVSQLRSIGEYDADDETESDDVATITAAGAVQPPWGCGASEWPGPRLTLMRDSEQGAGEVAAAESPVLVVEEDAEAAAIDPPVRREEYRDLFSRLLAD